MFEYQQIESTLSPDDSRNCVMWITPDRVFYCGLLGVPSIRTFGAITLYAALAGPVRVSLAGGEWQTTNLAVVPPYVPHRVACDARLVCVNWIEPETVDPQQLPHFLRQTGPVDAPGFLANMRRRHAWLRDNAHDVDMAALDYDEVFFGQALAPRRLDPRIAAIIAQISQDPSMPAMAGDCAASVSLSFSRFLHLFKEQTGAPFRSMRTWKRARSLLHYVNRPSNLTDVALETGYPDATHFSHSIRQVYGLKPKDIFAGSRRLVLLGKPSAARQAGSMPPMLKHA